jgi:hypothetical protein
MLDLTSTLGEDILRARANHTKFEFHVDRILLHGRNINIKLSVENTQDEVTITVFCVPTESDNNSSFRLSRTGLVVGEVLLTVNNVLQSLSFCSACGDNLTPRDVCSICNELRYISSTPIDNNCSICLSPLRGCLTKMPRCDHVMHKRCSMRMKRLVCPMRCNVPKNSSDDDDEDN